MKSLRRLVGLFLVSLFLASTWLSTLPGAEDPWDENKVHSDSSTVLGHGGLMAPDDTQVLILTDVISLLRGHGFHVFLVPEVASAGTKVGKCQSAPLNGDRLKVDSVDDSGNRKARK